MRSHHRKGGVARAKAATVGSKALTGRRVSDATGEGVPPRLGGVNEKKRKGGGVVL